MVSFWTVDLCHAMDVRIQQIPNSFLFPGNGWHPLEPRTSELRHSSSGDSLSSVSTPSTTREPERKSGGRLDRASWPTDKRDLPKRLIRGRALAGFHFWPVNLLPINPLLPGSPGLKIKRLTASLLMGH